MLIQSYNEFLNEDKNEYFYHASPNKFDIFDKTNDIGYHFGSKNQAIDRMKQLKIKTFYLYEVVLYFKNPLYTTDKKTWFGRKLLDILSINKLVNRKDMELKLNILNKKYKYDENGKIISGWSEKALIEWNDELKSILYNSIYDSIVYINKYEDKYNKNESVVVFNKNQIDIVNIFKINL